ncbi:MAG: DUF1326 domain-containing protein [Deltaproteobacteria bacterium]|nr:MAG: DUF1326 domain-containing protein [Deltaproteobacteria bacterium]
MAYVDWRIQGIQISNCNCAVGCPCQFNALPTHGHCRALVFFQIDRGHFGKVPLDGLRWGGLFSWPGPIHLGGGTAMAVIDERANPEQRAAIEAIAQGQETEPGSLITQVFSTTITTGLPTQFKAIELAIDEKAGTARVRVPGLVDTKAEPIKNPVTGESHRVRVHLPTGFEYREAEYVSATSKVTGPIALDFEGTHAHIAKTDWGTRGVMS